jgi:hypothetical protein
VFLLLSKRVMHIQLLCHPVRLQRRVSIDYYRIGILALYQVNNMLAQVMMLTLFSNVQMLRYVARPI